MDLPFIDNTYGATVEVHAGFGNTGFSIAKDGSLATRLEAALESFVACESMLFDGYEILVLKWGVYNSNGAAPYGCISANLIQNFNVS